MNIIHNIIKGSIAEELGIEKGDILLSINQNPINDIIDYKFLLADDYLEVEVEKKDGEVWELEIEKDYDEDLGIEFENAIIDEAQHCSNKCIFCFIDQLPKGMRKTLYFKDDDSRLSFLQGNFITLTNLKEEDINRIIKYRISPINVSVHTTNKELRVKMLNNRFAGNLFETLKKFKAAGIVMNCQIVLCPGINDGEELINTINDLYSLYPSVQNLAVVPVGITKYREGLYDLSLYEADTALEQIKIVAELQKKFIKEIGYPFVRLSDEFYITANIDVPDAKHYGEYDQLEDGVGMIRLLRENIKDTLNNLNPKNKKSFTIITGVSAFKELEKAASDINKANSNININVLKVINHYFGETITVAGLLTGKDIIEQSKTFSLGDYVIIPDNMLRRGYELSNDDEKILLDDITVKQLEAALNRKILITNFTGEDLIYLINNC